MVIMKKHAFEGRRFYLVPQVGLRTRLMVDMQEHTRQQENAKPLRICRTQSFLPPLLSAIREEGGISDVGKLSLHAVSNLPEVRDADPFSVLSGHIERDSDS